MTQSTLLNKSLIAAIGVAFFTFTVENAKPAVAASFTAVNFSSPSIDFTNNQWSLGFQFTTNKTVNVTALGFYDDLKNDLTQTHDVGIFDNTGNLVVKGTVSPGDSLDGFFRYTSVQSTVLQAGRTFFIAAVTGTENYTLNPTNLSINPDITFVSSAFRASNTLVFPGASPDGLPSSDSEKGYFGPNFKADEATAVPTPALLPGLLTLGLGMLRKRKANATKHTSDV